MTSALRLSLVPVWLVLATFLLRAEDSSTDHASGDFFEQQVRPLMLQRCGECHIENESGGLSLGSRRALLAGGDSGIVVTPGDPARSVLISAIRRTHSNPMPPEKPLNDQEIAIFEAWIAAGAIWPEASPSDPSTAPSRNPAIEAAEHWAFQPIAKHASPVASDPAWCRTSIDSFVLRSLDEAGLVPAAAVSPSRWLRRVTYGLTGLPPTREELEAFAADHRVGSYARVIERLLASPRYGQHQARFWLDLARYSDTKGYVYAREERFWLHAWNYRDWLVDALNHDMPYDRFLLLQLAADQVADRDRQDLAAMGFLTIGRRFLGVKHDIIDDRIDAVCRGTMALTVGCARCHDHKFDPIPTSDYYALYGVFDSSSERIEPLEPAVADIPQDVQQKRQAVASTLAKRRAEQAKRVRERLADYLWAQTELHKYPAEGFDQVFSKSDLLPSFVRRFQAYLREAEKRQDRLFVAWRAYQSIDPKKFSEESAVRTDWLQSGRLGPVHPAVLRAFQSPPASLRDVADRYGTLFQEFETQLDRGDRDVVADAVVPEAIAGDADAIELWQALFAQESPCQVPDQSVVHTESFFDTDTCNELWKLQGELERAILDAGARSRFTIALVDNPRPHNARIFRRGNPLDQGEEVPRRFLSHLSGSGPSFFSQGSGRLELARRIIDPANPLTARVIVNRVWAQHFGQGLVTTPSDFGLRSQPPSHPELLDYLARKLIDSGWSLKALHREMLLSSTYRQDSGIRLDSELETRAMEVDPENRLLWRMNPHRLTFEELRDSLLDACGVLDDAVGGPASPILKAPDSTRRTLYGLVDRQFLSSAFRAFDFASPDLHIPSRNETIVPQQALFLMNHPLVLDQVTRFADHVESLALDEDATIAMLFDRVLRRSPTARERQEAVAFVSSSTSDNDEAPLPTVADWHYGYGMVDEQGQRVVDFTPLPHFDGQAWQGGESYPDATLGWVQLSADGGHPGNDRQHACVRRWVAPESMRIDIRSLLRHEAAPGDGIRAFVISSRAGILRSEKVHQRDCELLVNSLEVEAGETIDFVVDIDEQLNSDQFLWSITITANESKSGKRDDWGSRRDFTPQISRQLSPVAQLAQILLCTNEFLFVD